MAVRVADILQMPALTLRPAGGGDGAGRDVRWVHVSELDDPTPWLRGGELLLTTGMSLGTTAAQQRAYLRRLADAGLAGLGLGTGFKWTKIPKAVVTEADRLGFPVFEVPYPVPFIAITEAVFTRLLTHQYESLQRSLEAQSTLTRALLGGGGIPGLVSALAATVGGWAAVLDLHGFPVASSSPRARSRSAELWSEIRDTRPEGGASSLALSSGQEHVVAQPVASRDRVAAFLVLGKRRAFTQSDRLAANHALSLVAIQLDTSRAIADVERRLRGDFLDALVAGGLGARELARGLKRFGLDPSGEVAVSALRSDVAAAELADAAEDVLSRLSGGYLVSPRDDHREVLILRAPDDTGARRLRAAVAERLGVDVSIGIGSAVPAAETARSLREARYALQICRLEGRAEADFRSLGTYRLLLRLQDPAALEAFTDSVLQPLDRYDRETQGDLVRSLSVFLDHNASWESASQDLFVHRHTLRYRIRKVEDLTGRDLASAHDRMEFWLALRSRDLLAGAAE